MSLQEISLLPLYSIWAVSDMRSNQNYRWGSVPMLVCKLQRFHLKSDKKFANAITYATELSILEDYILLIDQNHF